MVVAKRAQKFPEATSLRIALVERLVRDKFLGSSGFRVGDLDACGGLA